MSTLLLRSSSVSSKAWTIPLRLLKSYSSSSLLSSSFADLLIFTIGSKKLINELFCSSLCCMIWMTRLVMSSGESEKPEIAAKKNQNLMMSYFLSWEFFSISGFFLSLLGRLTKVFGAIDSGQVVLLRVVRRLRRLRGQGLSTRCPQGHRSVHSPESPTWRLQDEGVCSSGTKDAQVKKNS